MDGSNPVKRESCPSREVLAAVLKLDHDDQVAVQIREHLQACSACQARLDDLTAAPQLASYRDRLQAESPQQHETRREIVSRIAAGIASGMAWETDHDNATRSETLADSLTWIADERAIPSAESDAIRDVELPSPQSVGRYSILSELGRGGAGVVYLAFDPKINRKLALKKIHGLHARQKERLVQEAQAVAKLQTDEVVRIYSIEWDHDQLPFITMEYVDGDTLSQAIKNKQYLPVEDAVAICIRIGNALQAAHDLGILHRDVKPGNILLPKKGMAKLADFGLAHLGELSADLTQTGVLVGTPTYMSPEQATGEQLDTRSDVYSLGCVLYQSLTGSMPFYGTTHQVLKQVVEDEPIAVQRLNENVPGDLAAICHRAMAREPDRRYQSAALFRDDLVAWQRGDPVTARPDSSLRMASRWYARNRTFAWMLSAILLLMLATTIASLNSARTIAEENRKTREANLQARQAAELASQQRAVALDTLNDLIFNVQVKLKDRPGTLEVRDAILQSALDGLKQIVADEDSMPTDHSTIVAHLRIGEIEMAKGDDVQASWHFNQARQMADAYLNRQPGNVSALTDLAGSLIALGDIHRSKFDHQAALEFYMPALVIRDQVVTSDPTPLNEAEYCRALVRVGAAKSGLDNNEEATDDLLQAVNRMQALVAGKPDDLGLSRSLAIALSSASSHLLKIQDLQQAVPMVEQLHELSQQLLDADQENVHFLLDAAVSFSQLAQIHVQQLQWSKARDYASESRALHQRIVAANPENTWSRSNLGLQWQLEAMTLFALGDLEGAEEASQKNWNIHHQILVADPTNSRFAVPAAESLTLLAGIALRKGDLVSARQHLQESLSVVEQIPVAVRDHNLMLKQAIADNRCLQAALEVTLAVGDRWPPISPAKLNDSEKLAAALTAHQALLDADPDRALALAVQLAEVDIADPAAATHFRFCLLSVYAQLLALANDGTADRFPVGEISQRASQQMLLYLATRPNLLLNVYADPGLQAFRQTAAFRAAMQRLAEQANP